MLKPFTVKNKNGEEFFVVCKRGILLWELIIRTSTSKEVGFLRFAPQKETPNTVRIFDFQICSDFWCGGIGTQIFNTLFALFKEQGFNSIVGICKSSKRDLSEKENLASWYERLGFILIRESSRDEPGYLGRLSKKL